MNPKRWVMHFFRYNNIGSNSNKVFGTLELRALHGATSAATNERGWRRVNSEREHEHGAQERRMVATWMSSIRRLHSAVRPRRTGTHKGCISRTQRHVAHHPFHCTPLYTSPSTTIAIHMNFLFLFSSIFLESFFLFSSLVHLLLS